MAHEYYISRTPKLLKGFDKAAKHMRGSLASRYGDDFAGTIIPEARNEFEALIPELPYIGGKANFLTRSLVGTGWCLALYRVLKKRGKTVEETGEVIDATVRSQFASIPKPIRFLIGRYMGSKLYLNRLKRQAALSQERKYPEDWVLTIIDGDGADFDYGIDFTECGVCKFCKVHDAEEMVPCLCATDFPVSEALGTGLIRTTTLADGSDRCNFRFKRGRKPGPTA